ncbi:MULTISPECIES: type IV toxin-antitoxin system AbiEi family antitoxin domain-containing protein [Acidithrix]|uniref:AbiEi antitoxin N-terminal domain-containing protein n=1 Tax=Acidithrix ferrooxidans TaxID=1280514 RepID=A0A0D8HI61_9ACTN|nr:MULTISPECIES: type IV toxin-antitoxin system AbiEi family antitoxin domain-containing protein [Acidithrix]KJF17539.1 hypothetical protein AXFE_15990 [Acidithrix ferrooxidans]CAG4928657.1 unnamed protein product [Acidithrix sp. C25]
MAIIAINVVKEFVIRYTIVMTTLDVLLEIAIQQHGYVTVADARRVGVDPQRLRALALRGRAEQRERGLYRISLVPHRPHDNYAEAVLLGGDHGALAGEAALDLWDLADVNPRRIEVIVPPGLRIRRIRKDIVFLRRDVPRDQIDEVDDIRVVSPSLAIEIAMDEGVDGSLIDQAITNASRRELIGTRRAARLLAALDDKERGLSERK